MRPRLRQHSASQTVTSWIECCLLAFGVMALAYCANALIARSWAQGQAKDELDRMLSDRHENRMPAPNTKLVGTVNLVGRLEIPRIGISTAIFEGDDRTTLQLGIGHLTGSALPGKPGNVVLAAHRDSFFRPLEGIRRQDAITVTTVDGTHTYVVQSTEVVSPDKTSVLNPTQRPTLTLVTCYPFYYVGPAPRRFIVKAREVSLDAQKPPVSIAVAPAPATTNVRLTAPHKAIARTRHVQLAHRGAGAPQDGKVSSPAPSLWASHLEAKNPALHDPPPEPETTMQASVAVDKGDTSVPETSSSSDQSHRKFGWMKPRRIFGKLGRLVKR